LGPLGPAKKGKKSLEKKPESQKGEKVQLRRGLFQEGGGGLNRGLGGPLHKPLVLQEIGGGEKTVKVWPAETGVTKKNSGQRNKKTPVKAGRGVE